MSWQLVDAPSHVAPETGPNLLAGAGPWTVPLVLDGEYVLTVEVLGGGVVEWSVTGLDGEGEPVAVPGLSETVTDTEWVRVTIPFTAPAFAGDATVALTVPGESRNPELGELTGRTVLTVPGDVLAETIMASGGIIAGVEGGARVELNGDGLRAYDADNVETVSLGGEYSIIRGGTFDGGFVYVRDADGDLVGLVSSEGFRITNKAGQEQVLLTPAAQAGAPGINFPMPGFPDGTPPQVVAFSSNNTGGFAEGALMLKSAETTPNVSGRGEVRLQPDRIFIGMESGPDALNGVTLSGGSAQMASAGNASRVVANSNGNAEMLSSGDSSVLADSLGNARMRGKLGNRVLATDAGNAELQSSGGATVLADSLGGAKLEGVLGNRVLASDAGGAELQSSGGALALALPDGEARIAGSSGAQVRARPTGIVDIQAGGSSFYVARFSSTGVQVRDTLTVGGVDVMDKIAALEARIAALEA